MEIQTYKKILDKNVDSLKINMVKKFIINFYFILNSHHSVIADYAHKQINKKTRKKKYFTVVFKIVNKQKNAAQHK